MTTLISGRILLFLAFIACLAVASACRVDEQDQYFQSNDVRIRFTDVGSGSPVILVHGFTGNLDAWNSNKIVETLQEEYRVVALDCRGHGLSDKPHSPDAYGSEMALDIVRLMDHLHIDKAHVVGYSMGARLTGYLIATHPGRLLSATLGGSPPRISHDGLDARANQFIASLERVRDSSGGEDGQDYEALAAIPRSWHEQVADTLKLENTQVPILALVGSEDPRLAGMTELTRIVPSVELYVIEGATHGAALGRIEFLTRLQDFLHQHSSI